MRRSDGNAVGVELESIVGASCKDGRKESVLPVSDYRFLEGVAFCCTEEVGYRAGGSLAGRWQRQVSVRIWNCGRRSKGGDVRSV